jgi:hypothetical protein
MKQFLILLLLAGMIFTGCEKIDENSDNSTNDSYKPNEANTCNQSEESTLGCYGDDLKFGDNELLTGGVWSVYAKRDANVHYYNTYLFGYEFSDQGYVALLNRIQNTVIEWGINREGSVITMNPEGTITYKSIFGSNNNCYEITHSAYKETLKFCHDAVVDDSHKNELGFYSETIKFGNYTYGDYTAVGTWVVSEYGTSTTIDIHTLNADGTTVDGGNWGVSENGKILHVNASSYLINKYLNNGCMVCFDTQTSMSTPLQLCKDGNS